MDDRSDIDSESHAGNHSDGSDEGNVKLQRYIAAGTKYSQQRYHLQGEELEQARCEMADEQLRNWSDEDWLTRDQFRQCKGECVGWLAQAGRDVEKKYWHVLVAAADCYGDGYSCAGHHLLKAANELLEDWFNQAWTENDGGM